MIVALWAALAMVAQDILGVVMMQMESNSLELPRRRTWRDYVGGGWKAWAGALLDQAQWMVGIVTTTVSVSAFQGHDLPLQAAVFCSVSAANIVGSRSGQEIGIWLLRRRKGHGYMTVADRLNRLEAHVGLLAPTTDPKGP